MDVKLLGLNQAPDLVSLINRSILGHPEFIVLALCYASTTLGGNFRATLPTDVDSDVRDNHCMQAILHVRFWKD